MACAQCQTTTETLQRCAGCRTVQYCSRDCQRLHWRSGHKNECIRRDRDASQSGEAPARATMRLNLAELLQAGNRDTPATAENEDPADTIYYLMTAIPHLNDRSIFGPFHMREAFVPSLLSKVRQTDPRAVPLVQQMLDEVGLNAFRLHTVNIPGPGNHKLEIWLHKEQNAVVKAALPCPTWKILYTKMAGDAPSEGSVAAGAVQVADLQVKGTYLTKEAAEAAAMAVATRALGTGVQEMDLGEEGKVWVKPSDITKIVTVSYDSGENAP